MCLCTEGAGENTLLKRDGDLELVQDLVDETYRAPTKLLTKVCLTNSMVYNDDVTVFRVTTQEERTKAPNVLTQEMDWKAQSTIEVGDEVMLLVKVKATTATPSLVFCPGIAAR